MKILQDTLCESSVSIILDEPTMRTKAYVNSLRGRLQIEAECSPDIVTAVFEIWGAQPRCDEDVQNPFSPMGTPINTVEQRLSDVEEFIALLAYGGAAK